MNDEEPTGESSASRPRRRMRASAAGRALASRTTGWMVAAALAGSLVTLLLTGQLHSSQVSYVRPAAAQRPARTSDRAPARPGRLAAPAPVQASASARQFPVVVRPGRVAYRSAQAPTVLPRSCRLRPPLPVRAGRRRLPAQTRVKILGPRACRLAVQVPVFAGLPGRGRIRVLPRRAYRVAVPAPLPAAAPRIVIGRVAPRIACLYAGPPSGWARVIRLPAARRLVIVRGRAAKGGRVSVVPATRVRFFVGPGRRAILRGKPVPAGRNVVLLPAPRLAGHHWQRVVTIKGHRVVVGVIAPGRSWTMRPACTSPRRARRP